MSRSFVFKRPDGTLAGYLVAGQNGLRLRAQGIPAEGGELTLHHGSGGDVRCALASTQQEQTLPWAGGEITEAFALGSGRVLFATSDAALKLAGYALREAKEAAQRQWLVQEPASSAREEAGKENGTPTERPVHGEAPVGPREDGGRQAIPAQRRWPPPPCLKGAQYVGGQWLQLTGKKAGMHGEPPRCDAT